MNPGEKSRQWLQSRRRRTRVSARDAERLRRSRFATNPRPAVSAAQDLSSSRCRFVDSAVPRFARTDIIISTLDGAAKPAPLQRPPGAPLRRETRSSLKAKPLTFKTKPLTFKTKSLSFKRNRAGMSARNNVGGANKTKSASGLPSPPRGQKRISRNCNSDVMLHCLPQVRGAICHNQSGVYNLLTYRVPVSGIARTAGVISRVSYCSMAAAN
jgi:hypothetical protein